MGQIKQNQSTESLYAKSKYFWSQNSIVGPIFLIFFLQQSLADQVTSSQLEKGCLFPPLSDIREVSFRVAVDVVKLAYASGLATVHPEPSDKEELVKDNLYYPDYISYIPSTYAWPTQ